MFGRGDELHETIRQLIDSRVENDASMVDQQHIGQQVFDLLDLVGSDEDRRLVIEVVVEQGFVKGTTVQQVQTKRRLIEHQQARIDSHDQREV